MAGPATRHNAFDDPQTAPNITTARIPDSTIKPADCDLDASETWDFANLRVGGVPVGASAGAFRTVTAAGAYAVVAADVALLMDPTLGVQTVMLPAAPATGRRLDVKRISASANGVTIDGNGKLIDDAVTFALSNPNAAVQIGYDGAAWRVLN